MNQPIETSPPGQTLDHSWEYTSESGMVAVTDPLANENGTLLEMMGRAGFDPTLDFGDWDQMGIWGRSEQSPSIPTPYQFAAVFWLNHEFQFVWLRTFADLVSFTNFSKGLASFYLDYPQQHQPATHRRSQSTE